METKSFLEETEKLSDDNWKYLLTLLANGIIRPEQVSQIGNHTFYEDDEIGHYVCRDTGETIKWVDYLNMRDNIRTVFEVGLIPETKKEKTIQFIPDYIITRDLGLNMDIIRTRFPLPWYNGNEKNVDGGAI